MGGEVPGQAALHARPRERRLGARGRSGGHERRAGRHRHRPSVHHVRSLPPVPDGRRHALRERVVPGDQPGRRLRRLPAHVRALGRQARSVPAPDADRRAGRRRPHRHPRGEEGDPGARGRDTRRRHRRGRPRPHRHPVPEGVHADRDHRRRSVRVALDGGPVLEPDRVIGLEPGPRAQYQKQRDRSASSRASGLDPLPELDEASPHPEAVAVELGVVLLEVLEHDPGVLLVVRAPALPSGSRASCTSISTRARNRPRSRAPGSRRPPGPSRTSPSGPSSRARGGASRNPCKGGGAPCGSRAPPRRSASST